MGTMTALSANVLASFSDLPALNMHALFRKMWYLGTCSPADVQASEGFGAHCIFSNLFAGSGIWGDR